MPIGRRSFISAHLLRISEWQCSCAFHWQDALPSLPLLKVGHKWLYRQGAEWPFGTAAVDSLSVRP